CWYYLRYLDPHSDEVMFREQAYDDWMPVALSVGGAEHAVLHLLYARFWHKVLYDEGVVKHPEPFTKLVHQGMILGMLYRYYVVLDAAGSVARALDGDDARGVSDADVGMRLSDSGERVEARWLRENEVDVRDGKPVHPQLGVRVVPIVEK